ncbi:hypothetical protein BJX61DRAFT_532948 [Aspergillus egyptiacus]|nr:hypothetical protein BJX61DRAFT_532948 [Aspergillus egyptiacus]
MGSYTFRWPYNANEVFVTGTFDDWGKTIKLDKKGDAFEKQVHLPVTGEKLHYKFVVDGIWTTDNRLPEEDDGSSNINNVLYPDQIQIDSVAALRNDTEDMATLSGAAPSSTTAGLAGGVPKESSKTAAPGSTTAGLGQEVPLEQRASVPGGFPADTPVSEYSVNPIPASSGFGNPIHLTPGEKVPDPSTFNSNTVQSTVRTDKDAYDSAGAPQMGGVYSVPPVLDTMIPESSLPVGDAFKAGSTEPGYTTQSVAPTSTTAGLAAGVPLETKKQQSGGGPVDSVPGIVKDSMSKAHKDPEAAANEEVVEEKKELEHELQQKVSRDDSRGTPAPAPIAATAGNASKSPTESVPEVVRKSISEAHRDPEAAANKEAVEEKKDFEHELQERVPVDNSAGAPAPAITAATTETAPKAAGTEPSTTAAATETAPKAAGTQPSTTSGATESAPVAPTGQPGSTELSPRTASPTRPAGASAAKTGENTAPSNGRKTTDVPSGGAAGKEEKKKKKGQGFLGKLKDKFK